VLIDWWRHSRKLDPAQRRSLLGGPFSKLPMTSRNWAAVVSLVVGFLVCIPFSDTTTGGDLAGRFPSMAWYFGGFSRHFLNGGDVAFYVGFLVGGALYLAWDLRFGAPRAHVRGSNSSESELTQ